MNWVTVATRVAMLTALLTLAMTAPASANQWYIQTPVEGVHGNKGAANHRKRIPTGTAVEVPTAGVMKLHVKLADRRHWSFNCTITGTEILSNPTRTEAFAETLSRVFTGCTEGATVVSVALPWVGELGGGCEPCIIDRPEAIDITIGGEDLGVFEGVLETRVGDFDNPIHDEIDHHAKWNGARTQRLESPAGYVKIGGSEELGVEGSYADGETNEGAEEETGEDTG